MSKWAIVAIPSEQDYVWKLSSEKVPHMTLLFLGEQGGNENEERMALFLQHVAKNSLHRFGLSVDRRGVLGTDEADVLFFETNYFFKELNNVRAALLQDTDIAAAYHSTEQFPEWQPHLTLGYPATPAKEDTRDYPGISYVNFDRIALWTSDFDGPTFPLEEQELSGSVAMSITITEMEKIMSDNNTLAHHGVPGMKWGKRRAAAPSGGSGGHGGPTGAAPTKGFFNSPTVAKSIVLGSYGKKSSYTDPKALAVRKKAGKLRIAAAMTSIGGNLVGNVVGKTNPTAGAAIAGILRAGAGGLQIGATVNGAIGAHKEQLARQGK